MLKRVIAVWAYREVREDNDASDSRSERGKDNPSHQDEHTRHTTLWNEGYPDGRENNTASEFPPWFKARTQNEWPARERENQKIPRSKIRTERLFVIERLRGDGQWFCARLNPERVRPAKHTSCAQSMTTLSLENPLLSPHPPSPWRRRELRLASLRRAEDREDFGGVLPRGRGLVFRGSHLKGENFPYGGKFKPEGPGFVRHQLPPSVSLSPKLMLWKARPHERYNSR